MKMIQRKYLSALCAATVLFLAACAGGAGNGTNATGGNAAGSSASTGTQTGIQACDDYLAKVEKCILNNANIPDAVKTTFRSTQEQSRTAWKAAAANPQTKSQTETACKDAMTNAQTYFNNCN